jgi:hypothetical protein
MYAEPVTWRIIVPLLGIVIAAAAPLVRYAVMEQHEQTAIDVLRDVHDAQEIFHRATGGYAADISSLTTPCGTTAAALEEDVLDRLNRAGYALQLRPAEHATVVGRDCHGRDVTSDYYLTGAPLSAFVAGREAFATRSDGRFYLLVDGIAPREREIENGLAIPLDSRDSFRIP